MPDYRPRLPCKSCGGTADQHVGLKCLFSSQTYDEIHPYDMRSWMCKHIATEEMYDPELEEVFRDRGQIWLFESCAGQAAGRWTLCGTEEEFARIGVDFDEMAQVGDAAGFLRGYAQDKSEDQKPFLG